MQFIDDRRLADAGIAGDQHQLRLAASDDSRERGDQSVDLARAPVQFFGDQQPVWRVVFAGREFVDTALSFPFSKTTPKITLSAGRCLITLLSIFGEQLHDDC